MFDCLLERLTILRELFPYVEQFIITNKLTDHQMGESPRARQGGEALSLLVLAHVFSIL